MDALARSAWRAVARMSVAMAGVLLIPAGTFRYGHAWAFLTGFVTATAWVTAWLIGHDRELLARRLKAGVAAESDLRQKVIVGLAGLLFAAELALPGLDVRRGHPALPIWAAVMGNLLIILAFVLLFRVYRVNSHAAATVQVEHGQPLVTTGPYAHVRHPMYAAVALCILAIPLALGHPSGYFAAGPLLLVLLLRTTSEERQLLRDLPGYPKYCESVRYRLVPHIW